MKVHWFPNIVLVKLSPNCHTKQKAAGEHCWEPFHGSKAWVLFETVLARSWHIAFAQSQAEQSCICFLQQVPEKMFPFWSDVEGIVSSVTKMWLTRPEMWCKCCLTSCSSATESTVWTCSWSNRSCFKWGCYTLFDYLKHFMNKLLLQKIFME